MNLQLFTPTDVLIDEPIVKIIGEEASGSFCLLPRHTDFLSTLVPGILTYVTPTGDEVFLANDAGLLVKRGSEVFVAVRRAIRGTDLGSLRVTVDREFETMDEKSRVCQSAIASLEANFLRRFLELEGQSR